MPIRPYGDTLDDGKIQISFSLPLELSAHSIEVAKQYCEQLQLIDVSIVHAESLGKGFSFFIAYGRSTIAIDPTTITVQDVETTALSKEEIEQLIQEKIGRDIVIIGASTGSDAHTVGIDAIMNMKGYAGHYGLERYHHIQAHNLGSQVPNEWFVKQAKVLRADVLLVSQTVTQKEVHIKNLIELVELLEAENMRDQVILICGGARITHELAKELGYDAGFGPGKFAEDVATFAVMELIKKQSSL